MGIVLEKEEEKTLQLLHSALRVSSKSTYTGWIRYSQESKGRQMVIIVEALLLCWLFQFVPSSGPGHGINSYVFPMAIRLVKGEKLEMGPIYLK